MIKKKALADVATLLAFLGIVLIILALISKAVTYDQAKTTLLSNSYELSSAGSVMQELKQSLGKTALFFGMMNTAKELGAHAGISEASMSQASALTPGMDTTNNIPYLAVVRCDAGCRIYKRMPFVFYQDKNAIIGTKPETFSVISASKYSQNLDEVKSGKYKFYLLADVLMIRPGVITISACQKTECVPMQSTDTGASILEIGTGVVKNSNDDVTMTVSGDVDDLARLRLVAVSIYDKGVVESANKLLEEKLNEYQAGATTYSSGGLTVKTTPYESVFLPAGKGVSGALDEKEGFAGGVAWMPNKVTAGSNDVATFGNALSEENAKIRYWLMYWYAEYFVDNFESLAKPRLLNKIDEELNRDYSYSAMSNCGGGFKCTDGTRLYTRDDAFSALNNGLNSLAAEFNTAYKDKGITWKFSIPAEVFTTGNFASAYNSKIEHSTSECSYSCNCHEECTPSKEGGESCSTVCDTCKDTYYTCADKYTRRHTLNHIKILAEITDEKYKTFDAQTKTWANPKFQFFVELDGFDDNYCGGYYCDSITAGATLPTMTSNPSVPDMDIIEEKCADVDGQTCELGISCPNGKSSGSGTCELGAVCCKAVQVVSGISIIGEAKEIVI